jgi:polar amino acid transport system substrate-binding protein
VALKARGLKIAKVDDLKALRVVAFQDATNYLGNDFRTMAKANTGYSELANQEAQVKMLYMDRADAVVMDVNIFKYFRQAIKDVKVDAEVTIYPIFPPTNYKVAFINKDVCQKFNEGFNKLKAAGKIETIFKTYIK